MTPTLANPQTPDATINALVTNNQALFWLNLLARDYVQQYLASRAVQVNRNYGDYYRLQMLVDAANESGNYQQFVADRWAEATPDTEFKYVLEDPARLNEFPDAMAILTYALGNPMARISFENALDTLNTTRACMGAMSAARMAGDKDGNQTTGGTPTGSLLDEFDTNPFFTGGAQAPSGNPGGGGKVGNFLGNTLSFLQQLSALGDKTVSQYQAFTAPTPVAPDPNKQSNNMILIGLSVLAVSVLGVFIWAISRNRSN